ncbi:hypothetical protein CRUP_011633, partial [Coryphaenoides rupestris]
MEPEGPRLAPGGPPTDLQVPGALSLGEEEEVAGGGAAAAQPGRQGAQRRCRSFPSSLTWDSDSEKETIDEEDLQHFANPHGLANHSPGTPSSGLRLEGENDQTPALMQHLPGEGDGGGALDGLDQNHRSTETQEPNRSQPAPQPSLTQSPTHVKPKELRQIRPEEEQEVAGLNHKGKHNREGVDVKEPSPDVYNFPGDSDAESPPPASWAHCTFVQWQRKRQ